MRRGVPDKASFVQAAAVLLSGQLDVTFRLAALRAFDFIPLMEISTQNQDSLLPKIDLENPRQFTTSEMRKFYTAICAGKWTPAANGQPDWAFKALGEFCRCCNDGLRKKSFGYRGLKSDFSQTGESFVEPALGQKGNGGDEFYEPNLVEFRKPANRDELLLFLTRGKLFPLDLPVPDNDQEFYIPHTARVYLIFFIAWQELAALKTVPEIHNWLVKMKAIPADTTDKDGKDSSRNTRTLLKRIGFPLADKGGRPRKKTLQLPH